MCVDVDYSIAGLISKDIDANLNFNECKGSDLTKTETSYNVFEFCSTIYPLPQDKDCGVQLERLESQSEIIEESHLVYSIEASILDTRKFENETLLTPKNNKDTRYFQTLECRYQNKGFITADVTWNFEDEKTKKSEVQSGSSDFKVEVLVSGSSQCDSPLNAESPPKVIFICIMLKEISDPSIVITIENIWGTGSSNSAGLPKIEYLSDGCSFSDSEHEGATGEHDLSEVITAAIPIKPQLVKGANTMHYHTNISICMEPACMKQSCDFEDSLIGSIVSLPKSWARSFAGQGFDIPENYFKKVEDTKISTIEQLGIKNSYGLPLTTDMAHFYNWMDAEIERIRLESRYWLVVIKIF